MGNTLSFSEKCLVCRKPVQSIDTTLLSRIESNIPAYCSTECQTNGFKVHWQSIMIEIKRSSFNSILVHLGQLLKYKQTRKMILPKNYCSHNESCIACKEVYKWYRIGAENDSVDHQLNLAICYLFGIGVPKSSVEAAVWFGKVAATGNVFAARSLEILFKKLEVIYKLDSIMEDSEETDEKEEKEAEASDPI
jgi:TPR repeat protein